MAEQSPFQTHASGTIVDIFVQPRASKSEISGFHDGAVRLRITAPPVDGAANAAVIAFLSKALRVRKSEIEIVSGQSSRRKRVLVHGVDTGTVQRALSAV